MKIGVVCPVGPLDRCGYEYNYMTVMESLSSFGARVYLCSSTRNRANVDSLLARFPNVEYISNENTWFDVDGDGNEVFRMAKLESNLNLTLERCRHDGMDCAVQIHINQYIQDRVREPLRQLCRDMLEAGRPFEWLYKKYQLGNRLFHADSRVPWILNLQIDNPFVIRADSIHHRDGSEVYRIEHADFRDKDHVAIVDCPMEMTLQDLADVMNFTRGMSELNPQANPRFDWNVYLPYYVQKYNAKMMSDEPLDATGKAIVGTSRHDLISWTLLKHYRKPTSAKPDTARQMVGILRRLLAKVNRGPNYV